MVLSDRRGVCGEFFVIKIMKVDSFIGCYYDMKVVILSINEIVE